MTVTGARLNDMLISIEKLQVNDQPYIPPGAGAGTVSITGGNTVLEGIIGGDSMVEFKATLTSGSGNAFSVNVTTSDGTATVADNDYIQLTNIPLNFLAGENEKYFNVTVNGDTKVENNETVNVTLSNAT